MNSVISINKLIFSCGINIKIVNHNSNNMGNRSRTEIVAIILDAANEEGETKTKIIYYPFLSYHELKEYISMLMENNIIEYIEGANKFKTTEKGLFFLKMHNELEELLPQTTTIKNDYLI